MTRSISRQDVVIGAIFGGTLLTLVFLFMAWTGVLASPAIAEPLYYLALGLPVFGGFVLFLTILYWNPHPGEEISEFDAGESTRPTGPTVKSDGEQQLQRAITAQYTGKVSSDANDIFKTLTERASRIIRSTHGLSHDAARDAIQEGTWTDDPIAAAFLSDRQKYPVTDVLFHTIDPGKAYRRRVRRTIDAIESLETKTTQFSNGDVQTNQTGLTENKTDEPVSVEDPDQSENSIAAELTNGPPKTETPHAPVSENTEDTYAVSQENILQEWALWATLVFAALGISLGSQLLVVAATVPLLFIAATSFAAEPPTEIRLTRELVVTGGTARTSDAGDPGDTVTVRLTVENHSNQPVVDLRIADGVPDSLRTPNTEVSECLSLAAESQTTIEYELELRRGEHSFGAASVRSRGLTGSVVHTWSQPVAGDDSLTCTPAVQTVPLGSGTNDYAGQVPSDEGGSGLEFYSVREYQTGDPVQSIDWRRYAASRELATVEYRAERSTRIVCVVDARESQFKTPTDSGLRTLSLSATAAAQTFNTLVAEGHQTGVTGLFSETFQEWLQLVEPGTGPETRKRVTTLLDTIRKSEHPREHESGTEYIEGDPVQELPATLPGEAQVFLFSSVVDSKPIEIVERLRSRGYMVHVISPDVTATADGVSGKLVQYRRDNNLATLRSTGAHVVDWDLEQPLDVVIATALTEVSS